MATTYPLPTLACTVTAAGITAPSYSDILQSLQATFQSIYGSDAYIDPDSQDGQLLTVVAQAIHDTNDACIAAYANYSPASAFGEGLSSVVKINGIRRALATKSTVTVSIVGQVGTTIANGVVADADKNQWKLPASVTIPPAGTIDVTATAVDDGNLAAAPGTVTNIVTPTLGWQSVTNAASAAPGAPVEDDATLRSRQATSTALPSLTVKDGIAGAIAALPGVTQVKIFENDTNATDTNGLPPHSISAIVLGGVAAAVANAIYVKKTPGAYTYGSTSVVVIDPFGIANTIRFYSPTAVPIKAQVTLKALTGYTTATGDLIKAALVAYINKLGIAKRVDIGKLYLPAQLFGAVGSEVFEVNDIQISIAPAAVGSADIPIAFNEIATANLANMSLVVT